MEVPDKAEWDDLTEAEKSEQKLFLKLSLYDDLEIYLQDIFAKPKGSPW